MRGFGAVEALEALLPAIAVVVFALITQLGDVWFVFCMLAVVYWLGSALPVIDIHRSQAAFLIGLALGALALTTGVKQLFALPRPPTSGVVGLAYVPALLHGVYIETVTASGYGFPSGHALLSTVVWGGLALVLDVGTRRRRALGAGIIVLMIGFSRVALGVHYAVDVVAGVALGLGYLALFVGLWDRRTRVALWVAVCIAIGSVFVGSVKFDDTAMLGATVGAAVTWELLGDRIPARVNTRRAGILTTAIGLPLFGGLFTATYVLEPAFFIAVLASAVVLVGILALPFVAEQIENHVVSRISYNSSQGLFSDRGE